MDFGFWICPSLSPESQTPNPESRTPSPALSLLISFCLIIYAATQAQPEENTARTFEELYQNAEDFYADSQLEKALKTYQEILKKYPQDEQGDQVQIRIAQCYDKLGEDVLAVRTYYELITKDPNGTYASQAVSQIGNLFSQRYQFNEAISTLYRVYNQFPESRSAEMAGYLLGGYLYFQRMTDEAIKHYKKFLKDYPDSIFKSSAINQLMNIYINSGMLVEAEKMINEELKGEVDNVDLIQQLASIHQKRGKYDEAIKLYESALKVNPNNTYFREKLGEIYAQKGDKNRAMLEWSKLVSPNFDDYSKHQQLAYIYKSHSFHEEAEKEYKSAIALQPNSVHLYTQLADIYKIQNRLEEAADSYLNALMTAGIAYSSREAILSQMFELTDELEAGKLKEIAVHKSNQIFQNDPSSLNAVLTSAEVEFFAGQLDKAIEHFKTLAKIYPDQGEILVKYAYRLQRDGNLKLAAELLEEVLRLFPASNRSPMVKLDLAKLKRELRKYHESVSMLSDIITNLPSSQISLEAFSLLGEIQLYNLKDPKSALSSFEQIESVFPQMAQRYHAKLRKLECQILLGDDVGFETQLMEIASGSSQDALGAESLLGDFYFFNDKMDEAAKQYQKTSESLNQSSRSHDAIYRLALIKQNSDYAKIPLKVYAKALRLEKLGKDDDALKLYRDILTNFPKSAIKDDTMLRIGSILTSQGNYSEAISIYQDLVASDGLLAPEAQAKIADLYEAIGDKQQALKEYSAVVEKYPDSVLAIYARGEITKLTRN